MPREWDGIVSQYINRRVSRPMAKFLAKHTCISPNHITFISFLTAVFSGIAFSLNYMMLGGVLAQIASILDGVDGDLAVLTNRVSPFGGFLDAMLDRYGDAAILMGMTYLIATTKCYDIACIIVAFAALLGSLLVSYSRVRARADLGLAFNRGFTGYAANRDVRLFIIMVGGLLGQAFITLALIASLTNLNVMSRIWISWKSVKVEK
ncbi:MAG: CDP-alcohol phosphatidyltransferase family protein [Candidatus Bathyarchaeia archaeon]|nr:CDP-alcohol phosphatidyltransferase family protein [Candidatus Bathyarchaeota archaeon]